MSSKNYDHVKKHKEKLLTPGNEAALADFIKRKQEADKRYREKKLNSKAAERFKKKKSQQTLESKKRKALKDRNDKSNIGTKFKSRNGLQRAIKRVETILLKEKAKKIEVVEAIAENLQLNVGSAITKVKCTHQRHYFRDIPELVNEFYLLESVSRQLPGKKDFIIIKNKNGIKEKLQKRVMLTTIEDAYSEFCSLYPQHIICRSKFFELRPKFVLLLSQTPHNVCCCIYCSNFRFLFDALKPFFIERVLTFDDFFMKFICGLQYNCAKNLCELCWDYEAKLRSLLIQSSDDQAVTRILCFF